MIKNGVALIVLMVFLSACVSTLASRPDVPIADEVARLKRLGFQQVTETADGTIVLSYSGPITQAVECRRSSQNYAPVPARLRTDAGQTQTITLDGYLRLSPGADGVLTSNERDGIYVVTIRTSGGGRASTLSGATFGPRGQGSFPSGMTCRAA